MSVLAAFLGGVLALLSPCSALLLPSFFAYAFTGWQTTLNRTAVFLLGLATVFVPLGAGVGAIGAAITTYRTQTTLIAAAVIITLGISMILGKGFTFTPAQRATATLRGSTPLSVFALGTVYGLAGFCSGPLLGAVLTIAATGANPLYGALLMAVYATGMTAPLAVLALLWDKLHLQQRSWLRGRQLKLGPLHTHTTSLISGLMFIGIGALFLTTDGTANLGGLLSADTQVALQDRLAHAASGIDGLVLALLGTLTLIAILAVRLTRRPSIDHGHGRDNQQSEYHQNEGVTPHHGR